MVKRKDKTKRRSRYVEGICELDGRQGIKVKEVDGGREGRVRSGERPVASGGGVRTWSSGTRKAEAAAET